MRILPVYLYKNGQFSEDYYLGIFNKQTLCKDIENTCTFQFQCVILLHLTLRQKLAHCTLTPKFLSSKISYQKIPGPS